ncbi:MAG: M24 family metallopeptidase [Gemmatimonadota bacterium]
MKIEGTLLAGWRSGRTDELVTLEVVLNRSALFRVPPSASVLIAAVLILSPGYPHAPDGTAPLAAQVVPERWEATPLQPVLTHRDQAGFVKRWIQERFDTLLPELMRREGIDMWIIISREYNDDPVFRSMAPLETYSSRRRTILVFHDRGPGLGVERLSVGRFDYDGLFQVIPTHNDLQFQGLLETVRERNPTTIGVNMSGRWNHADGLTATQRDTLMATLGPEFGDRVRSAEMLAVGWLETKLPEETEMYRHVMRVAHSVIAGAFSSEVIIPGVTTADDVRWWMRQTVAKLGLGTWFHPSVSIARRGVDQRLSGDTVIQRGDLLHTDFGIVYLGFSTDTQHHAYVLRHGEDEAPAGLREGLRSANRLQDITMTQAQVGRTGNEALAASLAQARQEGLQPSIYWHSIGYHGHGAGVPLGMTDYQDGVPGRGEYIFQPNSWHSVELNVTQPVPEWDGQEVRFALEEDAVLTPAGWEWVVGRQERFYLIR